MTARMSPKCMHLKIVLLGKEGMTRKRPPVWMIPKDVRQIAK